jgi:predicted GIY-YIG superfamily endonuclease
MNHPKGYWTKERCAEEALKYTSRSAFEKYSRGAYKSSFRNKWIYEICNHMNSPRKPRNYWTKERCAEEALKYNTRNEFFNKAGSAYSVAISKKILDDICSHMVLGNIPIRFWTKERCLEEALNYKTRDEFKKKSNRAYRAACRMNIMTEICTHMIEILKPSGYWTKERCAEEALKYKTKSEFHKKSSGAAISSKRNGWFNEISSHMISKQKPRNYWTKERCAEEALKYTGRAIFQNGSAAAYNKALRRKWLNDICGHMEVCGSYTKRCIYAYEFFDNSVYVGLSSNIDHRNWQHTTDIKSSVYKKIKANIGFYFKRLTEYIDVEEAKKLENFYVNEYKNKNWTVLNKNKTGGIGGGGVKWNIHTCEKEALKYISKTEFRAKSPSAYNAARKRLGCLNDICSHMIVTRKPPFYWTFEHCKEEALKYKTRNEFCRKSGSAYNIALNNGWLDVITMHMVGRKPNKYWTFDKCKEEALKYMKKNDFAKQSSGAYYRAFKNKWLNEIRSHML